MLPSISSRNTTRLTLCPLQAANALSLHNIYQMEEVLRYFPPSPPPTIEKVERFLAGQEKHWQTYGYGNWGVFLKGESEIIGWAGLQYLPELEETEVGFLLSPSHWGKGYATEAAQASLRFGFENFDFDHIIALVHPENLASRRVIEKCELRYQETIPLWGIDLMRYRLNHPGRHNQI